MPKAPKTKPTKAELAAQNLALLALLRGVMGVILDGKRSDERDALLGKMRREVDISMLSHTFDGEEAAAANRIITDAFL